MNSRLAAAAAFVLAAGVAHADLPAPTVFVGVGDSYDGYTQTSSDFGSMSLPGGTAFASAANSPGAAVEAIAPSAGAVAGAGIDYSVEIDGPADLSVPFVLSYRLFVKNLALGYVHNGSAQVAVYGNGAYAEDHLYSANYGSRIFETCSDGCLTPGRLSASFTTGKIYTISLDVQATGAEAYADPKLTLDPTWARANPTAARQLSLSFSDGITNALGNFTLGVPEPASWALMITGVFGVGAGLRRRRGAAFTA